MCSTSVLPRPHRRCRRAEVSVHQQRAKPESPWALSRVTPGRCRPASLGCTGGACGRPFLQGVPSRSAELPGAVGCLGGLERLLEGAGSAEGAGAAGELCLGAGNSHGLQQVSASLFTSVKAMELFLNRGV